ncbi:MAG: glutamine--fructose-6-phosphate transaminase (isomerizing) [Pseudomonadota bacterium]|nr:glutamine--fructose-6-phosphate transaminase (isomerizing) [Pseudomonadota bacterium]
MCGIVAAIASRNVAPLLLEGLKRLEYRGYDSAGLALLDVNISCLRSVGRVSSLENLVREEQVEGLAGIAHTRWATHGAPTERNAHPHMSGSIAVVHNGIIENHDSLRKWLRELGYHFESDTDSEVIAHLVNYYVTQTGDFLDAVRSACADLKGAYAIAVLNANDTQRIIGARRGSPLLVGLGEEEHYLASGASALLPVTRRMIDLEEGDIVEICRDSIRIENGGEQVSRPIRLSDERAEMAELGSWRHFMHKEIHEQPQAVADTIEAINHLSYATPEILGDGALDILRKIKSVRLLACGTSFHAASIGRYWLESIAGIRASAEVASEYRYRQSVADPESLVIAISQSGETADTLAALDHARRQGETLSLSVCNVADSALVKESRLRFMTHAGPEIGVASTKAFTTQLVVLFLLTVMIARIRGRLDPAMEASYLDALRHLPGQLHEVLGIEPEVVRMAATLTRRQHALFLGRGVHYPVAQEGALKLKEVSYIHAEAYPAGELKHGPLALIDAEMPVIVIAPNDALIDKLKSNLQEVRARGGELTVFTDLDSHRQMSPDLNLIRLPLSCGILSPILYTVPLQLLAYHTALNRGTDVDKPRNLAKSVTVE